MSNEDFPALPGAPAPEPGGANSILDSVKLPTAGLTPEQVNLLCSLLKQEKLNFVGSDGGEILIRIIF